MTATTTAAARPPSGQVDHDGGERRASRDPVSVLFSRRVRKRREADFEVWARGVTATAQGFPGHVSASVLRVPGSQEYHVLYTFADRPTLNAWLDSDDRARWMAKVDEMTEAERGVQSVTGLET